MTTAGDVGPSSTRTLGLNVVANLARGVSASGLNVILPVLLLALLSPAAYAAWALVFALGAVVTYLDLGIPVTVQAMAGRSGGNRRVLRSAAQSGLLITGLISLVALAGSVLIASTLPVLFPDIEPAQSSAAQVALVFVVLGQCGSLLLNTVTSVFTGVHESHVPALVAVPARLLSLALAVVAAIGGAPICWIAAGFAAPLAGAALVLSLLMLRRTSATRSADADGPPSIRPVDVVRQSGSLAVWNIAMLIVAGLGTILVGRLDYANVPLYSFALVFVAALTGLEGAFAAPMLSELGKLWAQGKTADFRRFLTNSVRANSAVLFCAASGAILLGVMVAPSLVDGMGNGDTRPLLVIGLLMTGAAVRQSFTPYSFALVASQRHTRIVFPPLLEAGVNLTLSLVLGTLWGAVGVAAGYAIGSLYGVLNFIFWSLRRSGLVADNPYRITLQSVVTPVTILLPALAGATVISLLQLGPLLMLGVALLAGACSLGIAWWVGLRGILVRRRQPPSSRDES